MKFIYIHLFIYLYKKLNYILAHDTSISMLKIGPLFYKDRFVHIQPDAVLHFISSIKPNQT